MRSYIAAVIYGLCGVKYLDENTKYNGRMEAGKLNILMAL